MPHIRIRLMVGIGAGVGTKQNIRLGDVAVSDSFGTHGGLVQYDLSRLPWKAGTRAINALDS